MCIRREQILFPHLCTLLKNTSISVFASYFCFIFHISPVMLADFLTVFYFSSTNSLYTSTWDTFWIELRWLACTHCNTCNSDGGIIKFPPFCNLSRVQSTSSWPLSLSSVFYVSSVPIICGVCQLSATQTLIDFLYKFLIQLLSLLFSAQHQ